MKGDSQPILSVEDVSLAPADRAAHPKYDLHENSFLDSDASDEYVSLVNECTRTATRTSSSGVEAESKTMLSKMKGLMHPSVKYEVDFEETTKDVSYLLSRWTNNEPVGTRAFIPDPKERDKCYSALKIFLCAYDEAKQIPIEYIENFGDDGYHVYNDLVGERDVALELAFHLYRRTSFVNVYLWTHFTRMCRDGVKVVMGMYHSIRGRGIFSASNR